MKNLLITAVLAFLVVGCGVYKINFSLTSKPLTPYTGEVKIIEKTPKDCIEIGWINCEGSAHSTWLEYLEAAKQESAKYGANAIVFSPQNAKTGRERSIICKAVFIKE